MNTTLKLVGMLGILLFGSLFSLTFISPEKIEASSKTFVKSQIEKEVRAKYQAIQESSITESALRIAGRLGFEKDRIQANLDENLPERIAKIVAAMCGYDCEKSKAIANSITTSYIDRIKQISIAENTLGDIVKGKYLEIVGNLKLDLRIFLGSNFAMFAILLAVSFMKPAAIQHLFLPGVLLGIATLVSTSIYVFGQDWFYTILYNDYMGFSYLIYIVAIFGLLVDISFNKAKITTEIINGIAQLLGSAFSVLPC